MWAASHAVCATGSLSEASLRASGQASGRVLVCACHSSCTGGFRLAREAVSSARIQFACAERARGPLGLACAGTSGPRVCSCASCAPDSARTQREGVARRPNCALSFVLNSRRQSVAGAPPLLAGWLACHWRAWPEWWPTISHRSAGPNERPAGKMRRRVASPQTGQLAIKLITINLSWPHAWRAAAANGRPTDCGTDCPAQQRALTSRD